MRKGVASERRTSAPLRRRTNATNYLDAAMTCPHLALRPDLRLRTKHIVGVAAKPQVERALSATASAVEEINDVAASDGFHFSRR
jgi:hypothetical protein